MAWLIARQHRLQLSAMGGLVALLGLVALATELPVRSAYHRGALSGCLPTTTRSGCDLVVARFLEQFSATSTATRYVAVVPVLAALFLGAPLVAREFEQGTHRLVWTQSVTRRRWLASKVVVLALATALCAAAIAAITAWWRGPFDALRGRVTPNAFDVEGVVVPAYAVFALALGVLAGLLLRRTIPAMTAAAGAFVLTRLAVEKLLRPRYLSPLHEAGAGIQRPPLPRDWVLRDALVTSTGHPVTSALQDSAVAHAQKAQTDAAIYMSELGWRRVVSFQPDDRFWTFQAIEAAIFVALAVATLAVAIWLVRRVAS
jgi:hypothetical protein